jgi:hypothetical protein
LQRRPRNPQRLRRRRHRQPRRLHNLRPNKIPRMGRILHRHRFFPLCPEAILSLYLFTRKAPNPVRANSERLAPPQVVCRTAGTRPGGTG